MEQHSRDPGRDKKPEKSPTPCRLYEEGLCSIKMPRCRTKRDDDVVGDVGVLRCRVCVR